MVLGRYNFDLHAAWAAQKNTPLGYGSEFRKPEVLEPLLGKHPHWPRIKHILHHGSIWPLEPSSEQDRKLDLMQGLQFGNHKGATSKPDLLRSLCTKDVTHGYALPLPLHQIHKIPGLHLAPMNIAAQNTIDDHGRIVPKDRLTHDQSFVYQDGSGTSVNTRTRKDELAPCMFGGCLRRMLNYIAALRLKYPGERIVMSKIDFKSAYRRMHLNIDVARQTCTHLPQDQLLLMALRLTFGSTACPSEWCSMSETICDLTNAIMAEDEWNPNVLCSPNAHLLPKIEPLPADIPFGEALPLAVDIAVDPRGRSEVFIDDNCCIGVDIPGSDYLQRVENGPLLAIHTVARPRHAEEPIPREWMEALNKLAAEAGAEEIKPTLGWILDLRRLIISLPENKATAWSNAIDDMLKRGKTNAEELESNIGRYVHVAMILPKLHHFLGRLRALLDKSRNRRMVNIPPSCVEDLQLLRKFIEWAREGVDINILTHRLPTWVHRGDSCPISLGGYNHWGHAWRWPIPPDLQNRASNNLLEHLASIVGVWVDILAGRLKKGDCVLSMTDSTTSAGWLKKTNFCGDPDLADCNPNELPIQATIREQVCRFQATLIMEAGLCEYSQWIQGTSNPIADSFSRDHNVPDQTLTKLLHEHYPDQVPESLTLVPLPNEISSWLISVLQTLPVRTQSQEKHTRTMIGRGYDGNLTSTPLDSSTTTSSTASTERSGSDWWVPSCKPSDKADFLGHLMKPWLEQQSTTPFHLLFRPSGTTIDQTQHSTRTESLADFYNSKNGPMPTRIPPPSNKKPSPASC
jgi:hypothetical protein